MPKFEFDHRTGMMMPKKDDQIYFAGSMGGGLRIDDHKNNVKYVVERDGTVTNIFGIRGENVNLYDMRDARMIADRVLRKLGRNNKYSDYHYFLKGYHMNENIIKSYADFINENILTDIIDRSRTGDIRREDCKMIGKLPDGSRIIASSEDLDSGELVMFDDKPYYYIEDLDTYIVCFTDGNDTYYRYDPDAEDGKPNIEYYFYDNDGFLRENDFRPLIALIDSEDWTKYSDIDGITFSEMKKIYRCDF